MTAHLLGVPAVLLFGALALMILRSNRISGLDFLIIVLAGFYLGGTGVGTVLGALVTTLFHTFGGGGGQ